MNMRDVKPYREALLARLKELDERAHELEMELEKPLPKDWEDRAIELEDDEVLETLSARTVAEISRIRAALQRIREGTYGICVRCGDEIAEARLKALPDTPFCQKCAAEMG